MGTPDLTVYSEPSRRRLSDWTPDTIRLAEFAAERGELRLAAELCEEMLADDRLMGVAGTRADALIGSEMEFEAGMGRRKAQALRALEADEDWWAAYPEHELRKMVIWGDMLGVALVEQRWVEGPVGGRVVPSIEVKHPSALRYDSKARSWYLTVANDDGTDGTHEILIEPGNGKWILFTPYGRTRPWAFGLWRGCARWCLLKKYAVDDWAQLGENARGVRVGTVPEKTSNTKDRQELVRDIDALASDSSIVLPPGCDLKVVGLTADAKGIYDQQISTADMAITIAWWGQNLSTQVDGGSLAATESHVLVAQSRTRSDEAAMSTAIHDQSLVWWAEYNFGDRNLAPWPRWKFQPPADLAPRAALLLTLSQALPALDAQGVDTDPVLEEFGLKRLPMPEPAPPPAPAAPAVARAARLASGTAPARRRGFVQGQLYADAVADDARAEAADALADDVDAVLAAIEAGESYEDVRKRLVEAYRAMRPDKFAAVVEGAEVMSRLAGRAAVHEDTKGTQR